MSKAIRNISGTGVPVPGNDIDTDRITPARFLKEITFENMGEYLFYDERFDKDGQPLNHPLDQEKYKDGKVLIVGVNFGCGSSREHAPQAIMRAGYTAIIGVSFSEIFAGNCKNLGIPTLRVTEDVSKELMAIVQASPETVIEIDMETLVVSVGGAPYAVHFPEDWKKAFLMGTWDAIATLKRALSLIQEKDQKLPY